MATGASAVAGCSSRTKPVGCLREASLSAGEAKGPSPLNVAVRKSFLVPGRPPHPKTSRNSSEINLKSPVNSETEAWESKTFLPRQGRATRRRRSCCPRPHSGQGKPAGSGLLQLRTFCLTQPGAGGKNCTWAELSGALAENRGSMPGFCASICPKKLNSGPATAQVLDVF